MHKPNNNTKADLLWQLHQKSGAICHTMWYALYLIYYVF